MLAAMGFILSALLILTGALPVLYFLYSLKFGPVAGPNPWGASGLEWQTQSPPLTENFTETPHVHGEPYEYTPHVAREANLV